MESWDDKILADKINSLQDFPAGYRPNLSAKWELVEASLPANKKRRIAPLLIRWAVAATVLLAVGLVWINAGKKETASLAVKEQTVEPTVIFQQKQSVENELLSNNTHQSHTSSTKVKPVEILAYQAPSSTTTIPVRGDTNRGSTNSKSQSDEKDSRGSSNEETANNLLLPTVDTSSKAAEQNTLATTIEERPRSARKKIYQRDFNDGVLAMDTGFTPTSRQHFSIQLKPFSRKTNDDGDQPVRLLQLKQAL